MKKLSLLIGALVVFAFSVMVCTSCVKFPKFPKKPSSDELETISYLYPFNEEVTNISFELAIETNGSIDVALVNPQIPFLKYNKSWLLTLTQDDCKHSAYSWTWAALNGHPLTNQHYYDFKQLLAGDLPPDSYFLGKMLGSSDGAGNDIRFSFSTTLSPEEHWMDAKTDIAIGKKSDSYRFFMKSGLVWDNVREILNYGNSIAFHNVKTDEANLDSILLHYKKAQDIILNRLNGRGSKMLAEPDGNKTYVLAAHKFPEIQVMTAQNGARKIIPFKMGLDLGTTLIERVFYNNAYDLMQDIKDNLKLTIDKRYAINIGVHGVHVDWLTNFVWINDNYGKDGDDSVWFTSLEEYYEYNYYRHSCTITKRIEGGKLIISVSSPMGKFFYFPSLTLNLKGLTMSDVSNISVSEQVQGLSYANFKDLNGDTFLMVNVDCRKFMIEHATHFVERYEKTLYAPFKKDALYFVMKLKESEAKKALLQRLANK